MSINYLYHTLFVKIRQLLPDERKNRVRNFAWMMTGIFRSRSVHQSLIAREIPGKPVKQSKVQMLRRLLMNPNIRVRLWYKPIAQELLESRVQNRQKIRLIVDGTKVGFGHQLLMVSLAYRRRSIPIAWTWVQYVRGHSSAEKQIELLGYVKTLLPKKVVVFLVGDSEFGSVEVMKQLKPWHWFYALRQKSNTGFRVGKSGKWQSLGSFVKKSGDCAWLPEGFLTQAHAFPASVLVYWKADENEPWCLATNLPNPKLVVQYYKHRMWIDEMFGDLKRHGFDLESTMLRTAEHLSRLTLVVAFLFDWLISAGTKVIQSGLRHLVDRKDRRDLCLFQIGWRFLERQLLRLLPFPVSLCTYS